MSETMVERVARALFVASMNHEGMNATSAAWDMAVSAGGATHELEGFRVMARAAIEAMREPTWEIQLINGSIYWPAMIDAALSPNKETDR